MKKIIPLTLCISTILSSSIYAQDLPKLPFSFSGNVGAYSDYRFRGISQTQEDPAIQADVTVKHDSGFKFNVWSSNVDFNTVKGGSQEVDLTAAYQHQLTKELSVETGFIYYLYPGSSQDLHYDYSEAYASLGYDFGKFSLTPSVNVSSDFFGASGTAWYPHIGLQVPLPQQFTLDAGVGRQYVHDAAAYGVPDYTDWMLGGHYDFSGNTVSLKYQDTSISNDRCSVGCSATVVLSISRQF